VIATNTARINATKIHPTQALRNGHLAPPAKHNSPFVEILNWNRNGEGQMPDDKR